MTDETTAAAPVPASPPEAPAPAAAPRRGMRGNAQSMVLTTLAVAAITLGWLALVPRASQLNAPPVDVSTLATQTEREMGWDVKVAKDLPPGWRVTNVRLFETTDGLPTWHVGYQTPSGAYVAIDQTEGATPDWVEFQTGRGERDGAELIAGVPWDRFHQDAPLRRSLLLKAPKRAELTTVISGNSDYADLATLAHALVSFDSKALEPLPTETAGTGSEGSRG